jgi:hypothetical protein
VLDDDAHPTQAVIFLIAMGAGEGDDGAILTGIRAARGAPVLQFEVLEQKVRVS